MNVKTLSGEVDRVICPLQTDDFHAVGQFYHNFQQLTDGDVERLLAQAWSGKGVSGNA